MCGAFNHLIQLIHKQTYFKMNAIKQYRVKLLMTEISHEFSTINQVNDWIDNDMLKRNRLIPQDSVFVEAKPTIKGA